MKGRKPTPAAVKTARKNPGHRPIKPEVKAKPGRPTCPRLISGPAKTEWTRICGEMEAMGTLATADRAAIAMYCQAWGRWLTAEEKVKELGEIVAAPKTKTPMQNPWLAVANKAREQMAKILPELGLTPASRTRIHIAAPKAAAEQPKNRFFDSPMRIAK